MMFIGLKDMRLSDKYFFDWLKSTSDGRAFLSSPSKIGDAIGCHRNTVREMCKRLEDAGLLEIERQGKKQGYVYRVING